MYESKNLGRPTFLPRAEVQIEFNSRPNNAEVHMLRQMKVWSEEASQSPTILSENSHRKFR